MKFFTIQLILILPIAVFAIFTVPISIEWTNFDPAYTYDVGSITIMEQVYDCLLQYNKKIEPMIQTNVPNVKDGTIIDNETTYIFHIRKGIYFHDGTELTPKDVKYSFMRTLLISYDNGQAWILYKALFNVNSFEELWEQLVHFPYSDQVAFNQLKLEYLLSFYKVYNYIDKHIEIKGNDVIFHLVKPNSLFLTIVSKPASWSYIVNSKQVIKHGGWDGTINGAVNLHQQKKDTTYLSNHFQGCGPYTVTTISSTNAVLTYYKDYYLNLPDIKKAQFVVDLSPEHTLKLFKQNKYQIVIPYQEQLSNYHNLPNSYMIERKSVSNRGILLAWDVTEDSSIIFTGKFGTGLPSNAFSDIDFRKAFLSMFPFYEVNAEYWNGMYIQTPGAIPDGFPYFSISIPVRRYRDLNTQEKYFRKAWNGEVWKKGFKFTVYYFKGSKELKIILENYAKRLKVINPKFNMIVKGVSWNKYLSLLLQNKLVIIASGWVADYYDAYDFVYPYMASNGIYGRVLGKSYIAWQKQNIDPILDKILITSDSNIIQQYYNLLMSYNYYFQLGVYIQIPTYIAINDKYIYTANPLFSEVYLYGITRQKN